MNKLIVTGALALALAACAKKPPKELPPPPVDASTSGQNGANGQNGGADDPNGPNGSRGPGSQSDFVASVAADRIFFATDESDVDASDQATLRSQAAWLARYPAVRVTLEGHADERGTREYNLALGERRANSAKNALAALGVSPSRITTISYGKERPDALGSDEESYARNRRAVTVTVR